jgi:hypothetical protein
MANAGVAIKRTAENMLKMREMSLNEANGQSACRNKLKRERSAVVSFSLNTSMTSVP